MHWQCTALAQLPMRCRCGSEREPRAWADIPQAAQDAKPAAAEAAAGVGSHRFGTLKQWLGWLWGVLYGRAVSGMPEHMAGEVRADQKGTELDGERVSWEGHVREERKARLLQQDGGLSGQLLGYPGQQLGASASTPGAFQNQPGNPRPLFPTAIVQPPPTPAPQQLLQVSNNADGSQRSPKGPPLQSVDTASSFSALDVGSPPAITSPSVAVVSDSPCAPPPFNFPYKSRRMLSDHVENRLPLQACRLGQCLICLVHRPRPGWQKTE